MKASFGTSARDIPDAEVPEAERLPERLIQAAIGWAVRLNYGQPDDKERHAFEDWLRADSRHGTAWQRVTGLKGFQFAVGGLDSPSALPTKLARDALQAVQSLRDRRSSNRRKTVKLLAGAGITAAAGWLTREHAPWQRVLADASTGVGEQKRMRLEDGTVVVLNTDSAISIDLSGTSRRITLRRGEMLVVTGPDSDAASHLGERRPFWVHTPFGGMQALGTRFTVRLEEKRARVGVQEGAVALHPAQHTSSGDMPAVVSVGEIRFLSQDGTRIAESQGFGDDDWAEGVIAGKNIRLQALLAEMERYRHGRIVCDPRVAELRVSGLFHIKDTDQALQFLMQTQPIHVTYRTRWWVQVEPD
ncbi:FecR domain-containing protein [Ottowia thiooxydans]|uniref:FecR domain-containing protein n=1 Tax=Ottowia thiooxydans TaxID=219182 RepID=UPI0004085307|nr:FecR domain-containing protein [Ottowia thiooxydans]